MSARSVGVSSAKASSSYGASSPIRTAARSCPQSISRGVEVAALALPPAISTTAPSTESTEAMAAPTLVALESLMKRTRRCHELHAMRQPGKFVQHLQHRRHVEAHQLAGGQGRKAVRLVMRADQRNVAHGKQQLLAAREEISRRLRDQSILTVFRLIEPETERGTSFGRCCNFVVCAIDNGGFCLVERCGTWPRDTRPRSRASRDDPAKCSAARQPLPAGFWCAATESSTARASRSPAPPPAAGQAPARRDCPGKPVLPAASHMSESNVVTVLLPFEPVTATNGAVASARTVRCR